MVILLAPGEVYADVRPPFSLLPPGGWGLIFSTPTTHRVGMRVPIVFLWLAALAIRAPAGRPATPDDPRAVVRAAAAAVRTDSVAAFRARWQHRLAADSTDRAAALGLATLARLTYDYSEANRIYRAMVPADGPSDRYAVYAWLGWGQGYEEYGRD